jgi:hypothetical protein
VAIPIKCFKIKHQSEDDKKSREVMTLNEIFETYVSKENKKQEMTFTIKNSLKLSQGNFSFQREKGYSGNSELNNLNKNY